VTGPDGEYNDRIETWLSDVESKAAPVYERLLDGEIPSGQERAEFATFVASLHVRTPAQLRKAGEAIGYVNQRIARLITATPERFMHEYNRIPGVTPIELDQAGKVVAVANDPTTHIVEVDRRKALIALGASDDIAPLLVRMGWMVVGTDQHFFVSSDHPVLKARPGESRRRRGDGGFSQQARGSELPSLA
jgi:Protein of unknown function (DUF4238)